MINKKILYDTNKKIDEIALLLEVDIKEITNNKDFSDIDFSKKISIKDANRIGDYYDVSFYRNKTMLFLIFSNILVMLIIISVTIFGVISYRRSVNFDNDPTNPNTYTTKLSVKLFEETSSINLIKTYPISDETAKKLDPFKFKIINDGTANAKFLLKLDDYSNEYKEYYKEYGKLDDKFIKYSLECIENKKYNQSGLLSSLKKEKNSYDLINNIPGDVIKANTNLTFNLRLWIDSNATNEAADKYFVGKIYLEYGRD